MDDSDEIDAAAAAVTGEAEQVAIAAMRSAITESGGDPDRYSYSAAKREDGTVRVESWELGTPCPESGTYQLGSQPLMEARSYTVDWHTGANAPENVRPSDHDDRVPDHLVPLISDRGLRYLPAIPARGDDKIEVQTSSAAESSVWVYLDGKIGLAPRERHGRGAYALTMLGEGIDRERFPWPPYEIDGPFFTGDRLKLAAHLNAADARRLGEQLIALADQVDSDRD